MSSNQSGEGDIRRAIIEADLVDCMVALPGQLFYSTQIPVCLWFLAKNKAAGAMETKRAATAGVTHDRRSSSTPANSARSVDRVHRELTDADTPENRRTPTTPGAADDPRRNRHSEVRKYADVPGFCKSATTDEIAAHGHVLTPGRYVGAEEVEDDGEPFEEKMPRLVAELQRQFAESGEAGEGHQSEP